MLIERGYRIIKTIDSPNLRKERQKKEHKIGNSMGK